MVKMPKAATLLPEFKTKMWTQNCMTDVSWFGTFLQTYHFSHYDIMTYRSQPYLFTPRLPRRLLVGFSADSPYDPNRKQFTIPGAIQLRYLRNLHAKVGLFYHQGTIAFATVGSLNYVDSPNIECTLIVDDAEQIQALAEMFDLLWKQATSSLNEDVQPAKPVLTAQPTQQPVVESYDHDRIAKTERTGDKPGSADDSDGRTSSGSAVV